MNCRRYGDPGVGIADKAAAGGRDQVDQRSIRRPRVVCRGAVGGAREACPWRHCEKNATNVQIRSLDSNACSTCSCPFHGIAPTYTAATETSCQTTPVDNQTLVHEDSFFCEMDAHIPSKARRPFSPLGASILGMRVWP